MSHLRLLYCNFMPGFCGGISLGDIRQLDTMLSEGLDVAEGSVLFFLLKNDFAGLLKLAEETGYKQTPNGYLSKCHMCADIRKHLVKNGDHPELQPAYFYEAVDA